ncbi:MAG: aminotransferase class I/II-fold pyridoxal phosphate-dependent enzyme [Actinomycetota bacterium]
MEETPVKKPGWRQSDSVLRLAFRNRDRLTVVADALSWIIAVVVASGARFEYEAFQVDSAGLLRYLVVVVVLQLGVGYGFGLYRGRWRVAAFDETLALFVTAALVTVLGAAADVLLLDRAVPVSVALGAGPMSLVLMAAARIGWRLYIEHRRRPDPEADGRTRLVVFGAGDGGMQVVNSMLGDPDSRYVPVAFVDDDRRVAARRIRGLRVEGTFGDLARVAEQNRADGVLIAIPSATTEVVRSASARAADLGLKVWVLPPVSQILDGRIDVSDIQEVSYADLLGRREVRTDLEVISGYLTGRRVLVTGAGGSIGSELCRQLFRLAPSELVMLDRDESALHAVQLDLEGRAMLDSRNLVVADIRDAERMVEVFAEHRPDVVFHAAALKHLPLLEMHPHEAVKTNIRGTGNVLAAAERSGVDRFVNVSTDKAADPTSVLGFTKRIAERLTADTGGRADGTWVSVRFGNVLGSRGSVLTAFRRQIADGGPVTVTHPDATRYFMTVEEAVQLVIQAGAVGRDAEALVLDMGEPVRIDEVARRLIAEADRPVEISYTGLRSGEKLDEILLGEGEVDDRPSHPLISHTAVPPLDLADLDGIDALTDPVDFLIERCANGAARWTPLDDAIDLREPSQEPPPVAIRLARPDVGEPEVELIREVFASGQLTTGPMTRRFEDAFAERHEAEHAVALANGTIALVAMYTALDIGPGDEIIVPSMTFISTATSVRHVGATPVFAEIRPDTFNLDPADVARRITPRTKAVVAVHYAGQAADLDELAAICDDAGCVLLEDAAEAHGAELRGRPVGAIGRAGMFSFTPTKNITTGEGGIVTTNDGDLAEQLRLLRNHGMTAPYRHELLGHNWRMSDVTAAVGVAQLAKLDGILERKAARAAWMSEQLGAVEGITPPVTLGDRTHVHMLYTTLVDGAGRRDAVADALRWAGIESRVYFPPAHLQPVFGGSAGDLPVTEELWSRMLSLPIHSRLTSVEQRQIVDAVRSALVTDASSVARS